MPVPIIYLDEDVRHFAERFQEMFSKPQYQYFVTVLLGLMLCEGARTLSGLLQQIAESPSLARLSRFLSEAPWEEAAVAESWLRHFREEMPSQVAAELQRERQMHPKHRGRPKAPVVTGYLIGDDSTIEKRKGKKMVNVHVITTRVRSLYRCQVVIVRQSLDAPVSQARYWASSDGEAGPQTLLLHIAARWDIEVLFGDSKEESHYGSKLTLLRWRLPAAAFVHSVPRTPVRIFA